MKTLRFPSQERGFADHGWLKSYHTFNFADYFEPTRKRFGLLRVVNQDRVAPTMGFGTHPHANMEIVSIPLSGKLHHHDSTGNDFYIESGDVQIMSAGAGIAHSEYNASDSAEAHFLQIWVFPDREGTPPSYEQKNFAHFTKKNTWQLLVSPEGESGSLKIKQQAYFVAGNFEKDFSSTRKLCDSRHGLFVFCIEGSVLIGEEKLQSGDALGLTELSEISLVSQENSKILLIEVPLET